MTDQINYETLTHLNQIIEDVRSEYNMHNCLGGVFADHCDAVSEILLMVMTNHGYKDAELVNGTYTHAYPDDDAEDYGHVWVQWNGLIIDPTRCQFDNHDFVISATGNHPYKS